MPEDFTLFKELVKDDVIMKYISGKGLTPEQAKKKIHLHSRYQCRSIIRLF